MTLVILALMPGGTAQVGTYEYSFIRIVPYIVIIVSTLFNISYVNYIFWFSINIFLQSSIKKIKINKVNNTPQKYPK
jgi:hypothetical protein